jgi:hypothetical protein
MNETEITRQLTIFEELAKHLATREDAALLKVDIQSVRTDMQKLRVELILWIIGTNVAVGSAIIWWANNQFTQLTLFLQHWKP